MTTPQPNPTDDLEAALIKLADEIESYSPSENGGYVFNPADTWIGDHLRLCDLRAIQQHLSDLKAGAGR